MCAAGLLGAYVYSFFDKRLQSWYREEVDPATDTTSHADRLLGLPFVVLSVPLGIMMGAMAYGFEHIFPSLLPVTNLAPSSATWFPLLAGAGIGLLQIPLTLFANRGLGASSAFVTLTAWITKTIDRVLGTRLTNPALECALHSYTDLALLIGTISGSFLSATLSGNFLKPRHPTLFNLIGGFCLIFGARLAGGCTSGHGLTGCGQLKLASFAAVPAMFGTGILTGLLVQSYL